MDLALNNLQRLICHKTQQTNKPISLMAVFILIFSYLYLLNPPERKDVKQGLFKRSKADLDFEFPSPRLDA